MPSSSTPSRNETARLCNILIAYPYWSDVCTRALVGADNVRLVIDSGAFTAFKLKKVITLDEYCRFLETLPVKPWRYFMLDVIGDPAGTMRNYETMRKRGFQPIPIFTRGEDPSVMEDYFKTSDVVGMGGMVGTQPKAYLNGMMKQVAGRRVHWLGFTEMPFIKAYKPYMCDSSSWETGARYGSVRVYMGSGQYTIVHRRDALKQLDQAVMQRIRELGTDPYLLRKEASWRGGDSVLRRLCVASAVSLSLDVQKYVGTLMFNAIARSSCVIEFVRVMSALQDQAKAA